MSTLLVKDAHTILTMDHNRRRLQGGIFVRDQRIEQIGPMAEMPAEADTVIEARDLIILPGLVNTHHHFFQSLFRAVPAGLNHGLFNWLDALFPYFGAITSEAIYISSLTAMAELILSGCTTSSDHPYIFPQQNSIDLQLKAAQEIGIRFHLMRGAMSLGRSSGGLVPDRLVQSEPEILEDCRRLIETYHDPRPYSMMRVGLAPCTPFAVSKNLMRATADLARSYSQVRLHTHVAETRDEEAYCLQEFNQRPAEYMLEQGWVGPDVWWAHSIYLNRDEIELLAKTGTGVAHCPSSNMRLGSGICAVNEMLARGVKVGLGVDGSASNDSGHLLNEARTAVLLQRAKYGAEAFPIEQGLEMATLGGAAILGREEIGSLEPGKAADFIGVNANSLSLAGGAVHDPLAALLLCQVAGVDLSVINGRAIVQAGKLLTIDLEALIARHNRLAAEFVLQN
ncbi:MAG: 8-oxoguanine deaminase [Anaerolineales bacterium]